MKIEVNTRKVATVSTRHDTLDAILFLHIRWLKNCNFYTLKFGRRTSRAFKKSHCPEKPYQKDRKINENTTRMEQAGNSVIRSNPVSAGNFDCLHTINTS